MKILITGSNGQLGKALLKNKFKEFEVIGLDRKEFNLLDTENCKSRLLEIKPDWVINTAAYTEVDNAEIEIQKAYETNAIAVDNIAETITSYGGRILQISTDFVFEGLKGKPYLTMDKCNPINTYGKSKLKGENFALKYPGSAILRTSWLYGSYGKNFCLKMINLNNKFAKTGKTLNVINDQFGSPTDVFDLSRICWEIIKKSNIVEIKNRIFHWSNKGTISWYDFASKIGRYAEQYGIINKAADIKQVNTSEYKTIAKRPKYSVLDCQTTENFLNLKQINWEESLKRTLLLMAKKGK